MSENFELVKQADNETVRKALIRTVGMLESISVNDPTYKVRSEASAILKEIRKVIEGES